MDKTQFKILECENGYLVFVGSHSDSGVYGPKFVARSVEELSDLIFHLALPVGPEKKAPAPVLVKQ